MVDVTVKNVGGDETSLITVAVLNDEALPVGAVGQITPISAGAKGEAHFMIPGA